MNGLNKASLIGNLGADPEVRFTAGGQPVTNFRIATSDSWTDKAGQKQERTEWHRIVAWGKLAEACGSYLAKGKRCYVAGKIQTRQWTDQQGQQHYSTEIVAREVLFLDSAGGAKAPAAPPSNEPQPPPSDDESSPGDETAF